MDTAGKAVLFSGLTVLISLSAVMLVPSPAFRSMALGIMLAVIFVLAATLTLLPAVLAKLGPKVDSARAAAGCTPASTARRASPAGASGSGATPTPSAPPRSLILVALALPVLGLKTGMPSIKVVPSRRQLAGRLHAGAAGLRPRRARRAPDRRARSATRPPSSAAARRATPASPGSSPAQPGGDGARADPGGPDHRPLRPSRRRARSTACAPRCPPARWSAARPPRTTTSKPRSPRRRRW